MAIDTQTAIDQLEVALATGSLTVTFEGVTHTYKTSDDVLKALRYFKDKLAATQAGAANTIKTPGTTRAVFTRD